MSGVEATEKIREEERLRGKEEGCIVIGLTCNYDPHNLLEYKKCGMNGCIAKGQALMESLTNAVKMLEYDRDTFADYTHNS